MRKKITIFLIVTLVIIIFLLLYGYFFIIDIESKVPKNTIDGIQIDTEEFMSRKVFTILPKNEKSNKTILYFHGGAYMAEMTRKHWNFLQKLAIDTNSKIIIPDYPLAPKYKYKDVLKISESIYKETIKEIDNNNLILIGDSAGGGICMGLEEILGSTNVELPAKTILISPWLDTTMSNPKIDVVQSKDKKLDKFKLYIAGFLYSRWNHNQENYFVNPLFGDCSKLKNITIYTGTYDILNPDCHILQEKAKKVGVDITLKEYNAAPHIWIIDNDDNVAKIAYGDLLDVIN